MPPALPRPYDELMGKRIRVRDSTLEEYEGRLVAVTDQYLELANGNGERVWVRRVGHNIASIRLLVRPPDVLAHDPAM